MKIKTSLCTPATVYSLMSLVVIIFGMFSGVNLVMISLKVVFVIVLTLILNMLCKKGYKTVSWLLVVLPFLLIVLARFTHVTEGADADQTSCSEDPKKYIAPDCSPACQNAKARECYDSNHQKTKKAKDKASNQKLKEAKRIEDGEIKERNTQVLNAKAEKFFNTKEGKLQAKKNKNRHKKVEDSRAARIECRSPPDCPDTYTCVGDTDRKPGHCERTLDVFYPRCKVDSDCTKDNFCSEADEETQTFGHCLPELYH